MDYYNILLLAILLDIEMYSVSNYIGNKYITAYREINPQHKKFYVLKNFLKSIVLGFFILNYWNIYESIIKNGWNNSEIYSMTIMYIINDLSGLIIVNRKLPRTTQIHHICVTILGYFSLKTDYTQPTVMRLVFINAYFSSMAFLVNLFLAVRIVYPKNIITYILSIISLFNYIIVCVLNWGIHYFTFYNTYMTNNFDKSYIYYFIIFHLIMRDDLILMKWLKDFKI